MSSPPRELVLASLGEHLGQDPPYTCVEKPKREKRPKCATFTLQHQLLLSSECVRPCVRCFPSSNNTNKKAKTPSCFLHATYQKNHKLLDSRFFSGGMFHCKGLFFFFNVLYDLQKVAALTRYYALGYFLSSLHLPLWKEFQTIWLIRYFPLERIINIKLNQLCSPFYTQHPQQ